MKRMYPASEIGVTKAQTRTMLVLLASFASLAPMSIDMYLPGIPAITKDLNASPAAVTATVSIFIGGMGLGQFLAGPWSDRVGRRIPIFTGLVVYLVGTAAAIFAPTIVMLLVGRVLQSLGASSVMVTGRAIVRDRFDEREAARFFSTLALVAGLAPVLAPIVGTAVLSVAGWRTIFVLMGSAAAVLLIVLIGKLSESRSAETEKRARESHPLRTYASLLRNRHLVGYLLAAGFNSACLFTYLASAPLVLMRIYGVSASAFSAVVASNAIGLLASSQLSRILLKTRAPQQVLRGSAKAAVVMAVIFAVFAFTLFGGLPVLLALIFMVVASLSIVQANTMACALSIDPSRAGSIAALFGLTIYGMGTAMSFLAGLFFDGTARPMVVVIALSLAGTAATIRLLALPKKVPV
jgi:DHA1 family bicyclomycin/chloramphenicol resistance-like MFS transporter